MQQIKTSINYSLSPKDTDHNFKAFHHTVINELSNIFGGLQQRIQAGMWGDQSAEFGKTSYDNIGHETGYIVEFCSEKPADEIRELVKKVLKFALNSHKCPVNWVNFEQWEVNANHICLTD